MSPLSPLIVKLGGSVVAQLPASWWDDLAAVASRRQCIVVHGWSAPMRAAATGREPAMLMNQFGHRSRYTDESVLRDIRRVSQTLRAEIEGRLAARGVDVTGVEAAAAGLVSAEVRPQRWWIDGELRHFENLVGPVRRIDAKRVTDLLADRDVLVITPLATSTTHPLVNTDADRCAAEIAVAVAADHLVVVTDVAAVLVDEACLETVGRSALDGPFKGQITGGMRKKVVAALRALDGGVLSAAIGRATVSDLLGGLAGTRVVLG